jgi:hypothetical protein
MHAARRPNTARRGVVVALVFAGLALPARLAHAQTITGRVVEVGAADVEVSVTGDVSRLHAGDPGYLTGFSGGRIAEVEVQSVSGTRVKARLVRWTRVATVGMKAEFTASDVSSATRQPAVASQPPAAQLPVNHVGVTQGESREAASQRQACDRGDMAACSRLALLCLDGTGVAKDEARAAALYRRACAGGNALGCASLEWIVERLATSGRHALKRASVSDDRLVYEEALRAFDEALALDPSQAEALIGRAEATRRIDDLRARSAAIAFVQGETTFVASSAAATGIEAVRLVIEARPAVVRPGDAYVLRYSLLNPSAVSLAIGTVSVRNALGGAGVTGGSVEPQSRTTAPKSRTLLVESKGTWSYDASTAWATTLTVVLDDGSVYSSTLRAQRE